MPSLNFKVQGNGYWQLWSSFEGADEAYQCVDDSDTTSHDSGTSYILLPRLLFELDGVTPAGGRMSFPIMYQCECIPESLTLNVGAREDAATNPALQIGFWRSGSAGFHAATFQPTASYGVASRTFSTDPITGAAWTVDGLLGLEACVQSASGTAGANRITLLSGSVAYTKVTNAVRPEPVMAVY